MLLLLVCSCQSDLPEEIELAYEQLPKNIDYNLHVRPILSDKCFSCHGPDANTRKGGFRLDIKEDAFSLLENGHGRAIVAGNPSSSLLIERIFHSDPELLMPPAENNQALTEKEKATLYKWIEQNATYKDHWAFIAPVKGEIPEIENGDLAENEIDHFIIKKIKENGLTQSSKADKERLLRRVTMDLTGLPPTITEIDNFLKDDSKDAYEKIVNKLLESKAYGERMAMEWMDVARYADSHGMHADGARIMYPWRDWVIEAFNKNLSYQDFVTWQLAGDLLPDATFEQKLATAFNRNHTMTAEGGAIDEEFRLSYVFDRTETMATAFMGLTVGCAKCHDHKFDPFSQKEYYQLTAFFNNVKELGMTGDDGNYGPMIPIMSEEATAQLINLQQQIAQQSEKVELTSQQVKDIKAFAEKAPTTEPLASRIFYGKADYIKKDILDNNKSFTSGTTTQLSDDAIKGKSALLTGDYDELYIKDIDCFEATDPFSAALWINSTKKDSAKTQTLLATAGEKNNFWRGWEFELDDENRINFKLIHSYPHNYLHVRTKDSISTHQWQHLGFTNDGTAMAKGVGIYLNGKKAASEIVFDNLYKSIHPVTTSKHLLDKDRAIRVGKSYRNYTGESGVFKGKIDEIKVYNKSLTAAEMQLVAALPEATLNENMIAAHHVQGSPEVKKEMAELRNLVAKKFDLLADKMEVMVMEEMPTARPAFIYNRGVYTEPTEEVKPITPKVLPDFPKAFPQNRLGLSQWLFSKEHPLTARVTVNRYWQMMFGKGIVASTNDFGLQGALPSHPDLLDYLAVEFQENNWDMKWLIKKMVMSHTYRQTSKITEEHLEKDAANIMLAHAPTYRLPAEMIRDNALAASGLLVSQAGGESVKPYQPEGLWIEKSSFSYKLLTYKENRGDSLYRRSLYTFIRRTSPHPAMTIFDVPNREICTVKRELTSTPLQALVLLNDPQFVEAARVMAERIQVEGGESISEQIQYAFRLTTGRKANAPELEILEDLYNKQYTHYSKNKKEAKKIISVGDFQVPEFLDVSKTAALSMVTNTIINHNEAYIKR